MNLPPNIIAVNYDGDVLLKGPNLDATTFTEIMTALSPEDRERVMGWVRVRIGK